MNEDPRTIKTPFITIGYEASGNIGMSIDTEPIDGRDEIWFAQLLASLTRGMVEILVRTNELPKSESEQLESSIVSAYVEDMQSGPKSGEDVYRLD